MENKDAKEVKEFAEERFDFALFVNDNLICKRNFRINGFIPESMQSINFKETIDGIVRMIDDDLKSKSRVYTWYYYNEEDVLEEFVKPPIEPWECTFKFVVYDNKVPVITKVWDGYGYPKMVRDRVDMTNRLVRKVTREGVVYNYNKDDYFGTRGEKISPEMYVLRAQIMDKPDILYAITKGICEVCSPREDLYQSGSDYTVSETFKTVDVERDENGNIKYDMDGNVIAKQEKNAPKKQYQYSIVQANRKLFNKWGALVQNKTKEYFKNLY